MEEIKEIKIDDLCRLCLTRKSSPTSFMKMTEVHTEIFKEITNRFLPLNQNYPQYACLQCCVDMEKYYNYKSQLITRQEELEIILHNYATAVEFIDEESQVDMVEEYIDDSDGFADESNQSLIEMPSVKNLKQPTSNDDIVKLIEDIEKRNQMIFESSKPTVAIRKRSVKKKEMKSNVHKERVHTKHAVRSEAIKVEKLEPKLILKPVMDKTNKTIGVITYDREKYSCSNCQEKFPSQFLLKRHMAKAHPLEKPMVCCDQ